MLSEKRLHVLLQHFCSSNSTASSVVWQRAMVEIYERTTVTLSYAGAPNVPIPATLLVQGSDGSKYLKVRPSNYAICKLICGDAKCKAVKNPSLRSSPALAELQSRMQKALALGIARPCYIRSWVKVLVFGGCGYRVLEKWCLGNHRMPRNEDDVKYIKLSTRI